MNSPRTLTQQELITEATARFGKDPLQWAFLCPSCGDVANGNDFSAALEDHPRKHRTGADVIASDIVGQECIGRTLGALAAGNDYAGRGCNWAAYGLFSGPWTIVLPNERTMYAFALADPA